MNGAFREVDHTTRGTANLARAVAVILALSGVGIVGLPFVTDMPRWTIPLMALAGLFVVLIGFGLWSSESASAADTARLEMDGVPARATVVSIEDHSDSESSIYLISLRVAADGLAPIDVTHRCSRSVCLDAARQHESGQSVTLPAVLLPSTGEWMLTHR